MYKSKVFLSGGFKSNWQANIIERLNDKFLFLNPRDHGLEHPEHYTAWDTHFVKNCDIFFGYMEKSNPSGYGLSFELGIAYALNKTVILVDERSEIDNTFGRYFKMLHNSSNVLLDNIEDGIKVLESFYIYF